MRSPDAGDVLLPALTPIRTRAAVAEPGTAPEHASSALLSTPPEAEEEVLVAESRAPTAAADEEESEPRTPTSEESKLRPPTECPPAPRKPTALFRTSPPLKRPLLYFDVTRDLSAVFMSLPPKKRIRAPPCLVPCRPRCGPARGDGSLL
ncbi:predicted GPI-anchored protein 58 [Lolium rigidum]|uniref:predicted GPI-anchored protein 58 n=1 Tax=Lolium rigidum TaxID=89674 RepID=UPI001F5C1D5E|nr:predicted GPI-anchored protein 58 [Lolium rigidum]